jgi:hypothetical protein
MARRLLWVGLAALAIAAVTALIFLIRAGDPGATNWPINFELHSSDNGVLFQFSQDVFDGRALDWSFSPQVFVFPEIPISLIAYLLAGGTVQLYYLFVAAIYNAIMFLGLFAVIRYLFAGESLLRRLARAAVAMFPLLLLPLLGNTWLFEYALAPTYYFGMYVMIVIAPLLFFPCRRWVKVTVGVGLALTAASNPLVLLFVLPGFACVLLVRGVAGGFRSVARPAAWAGGVVVLAVLIRLAFFGRLQGQSPFDYVSTSIFAGRIEVIRSYLLSLFGTPVTAVVLVVGLTLAAAGLVVGIVLAIQLIRRRIPNRAIQATALYYSLVPVTGLVATVALLITDYLYLWPVIVLPLMLALLPLPRSWVPWALDVTVLALVVAGAITGAASNLGSVQLYFTYRSAETQCLDAKLPPGMTVGYSTFSDARRLELTSQRGFRLIQLKTSGVRAYWLTNRDYARDNVGRFFYINQQGDEAPINTAYLTSRFGQPDATFSCGPGQNVLIYTDPTKLAKIKARYSTLPAP